MKAVRSLAGGFALPTPPKRTTPPESAARAFVEAEDGKAAPKPSRLRRAELGERMAVYLPPELAAELRVRCARERRSLSDAVTTAVEAWVRGPMGT